MKIAIVGSRTFDDYDLLVKTILERVSKEDIELIISGGCRGADSLAKQFSNDVGIEIKEVLPDWTLGKKAGILRNIQIINLSDTCFIFWDGVSRGTKFCIDFATKLQKPIILTCFKNE